MVCNADTDSYIKLLPERVHLGTIPLVVKMQKLAGLSRKIQFYTGWLQRQDFLQFDLVKGI